MRPLAVLVFALLAAPSAFAADSAGCIRRNDIRDWASPAARRLIVQNYAGAKVLLTLTGNCAGFGPYDSFQITGPLQTAASCIAEGDVVRTRFAGEPGVCTITSLTPYGGDMHPKGAHHLAY